MFIVYMFIYFIFLCLLVDLGIYWGLSTILKTSNKSLWNNVFWRLKVYIFWKFIQYTIHWNKAQIVKKKFPSSKINVAKNEPFSFCEQQLISFTFNSRFLCEWEQKAHLSKSVCRILYFRFRLFFIKVYIFAQQKVWVLDFKVSKLLF